MSHQVISLIPITLQATVTEEETVLETLRRSSSVCVPNAVFLGVRGLKDPVVIKIDAHTDAFVKVGEGGFTLADKLFLASHASADVNHRSQEKIMAAVSEFTNYITVVVTGTVGATMHFFTAGMSH